MDKVSFLKSLGDIPEDQIESLTENINYKEYEVITYNNKSHTLHIPLRETEKFESTLNSLMLITETDIQTLIKTHNGVTRI